MTADRYQEALRQMNIALTRLNEPLAAASWDDDDDEPDVERPAPTWRPAVEDVIAAARAVEAFAEEAAAVMRVTGTIPSGARQAPVTIVGRPLVRKAMEPWFTPERLARLREMGLSRPFSVTADGRDADPVDKSHLGGLFRAATAEVERAAEMSPRDAASYLCRDAATRAAIPLAIIGNPGAAEVFFDKLWRQAPFRAALGEDGRTSPNTQPLLGAAQLVRDLEGIGRSREP